MKNYNSKFKKIIAVLIIGFVLFPATALAAKLFLEPTEAEYYQDDTFLVEIRLNTEGEIINTVEANLVFPQDVLEVKDFSQGNSILTLWTEEPVFSNQAGIVSFSGGVPGGYQGSDGILGKIIFKIKEQEVKNKAEVLFSKECQILLNDGLGTKAPLTTQGTIFDILVEKPKIPEDQWQKEIEEDKIPPEPFRAEISQNPSIFEGKYFITFSTTDKQTGIDHYEVKEGEKGWKIAKSPYLLENQSLGEEIQVKVMDKAGNARIQMIRPAGIGVLEEKLPQRVRLLWLILILLGILVGVGLIYWIVKKLKTRKKK